MVACEALGGARFRIALRADETDPSSGVRRRRRTVCLSSSQAERLEAASRRFGVLPDPDGSPRLQPRVRGLCRRIGRNPKWTVTRSLVLSDDGTVQRCFLLASESSRMAAIPAASRSRSGGSSSFQCSASWPRSAASRGSRTGTDSARTREEELPPPAGMESLSHETVACPKRLESPCGFPMVKLMPNARQIASARERRGSWPRSTRRIASLGNPEAVAEPATERPTSALATVARYSSPGRSIVEYMPCPGADGDPSHAGIAKKAHTCNHWSHVCDPRHSASCKSLRHGEADRDIDPRT